MMQLYGFTRYDRSAKVRWLLTELGIEFQDRLLDRKKKEHEAPEFLRLNPMGRVPTLVVNERPMFESGAICAFLADLHPEKGLAPAPGAPERAEYLQWMFFASAMLDTAQIRIMVIEDIPPGEVQATKQSILQSDLRDALEALDHALTGGSPYLVGGRFTAADIAISYHLYWLSLWPELDEVIQTFPRITDYVARMRQRPSALKADVFSYEG